MNALGYAQLAKAAYTAIPTYGEEKSASRAVVSSTDDGLCVGFPGTDNPECFVADLDCVLHYANSLGIVHRGFWLALDELWGKLQGLVPAVVYGHSLGGAMAILYAARLAVMGKAPKVVYAFEPPRVTIQGKVGELLAGVDLRLYRNGRDLVPMVPIAFPLENWQHPAPLVLIGKALHDFDNAEDHAIDAVIGALAM